MSGPCGWAVEFLTTPTAWESADADEKDLAEELAVNVLWALTGRVFGLCDQTVRPCFGPREQGTTYRGSGGGYWWPGLISGTWFDGACGCSAGCDCVGPSEVALPGPVASITEVWVDGQELDAAAYKIRNSRWLLRVDGEVWPQKQDLTVGDHAEGAFTVTYKQGIPVPRAGQIAAGELALEFLAARKNDGRCKLPDRAISVSRQGVDYQLVDAQVLFEQGLTGIASVDQWIATVNPHKRKARSKVYSPDAPRVSRVR